MGDVKAMIDLATTLNTPLLACLTWLVWRVFSNHLPHLQNSLDEVNVRLARLEGRQEERDRA